MEVDLSENEGGEHPWHECYAGGKTRRKTNQVVGEAAVQGLLRQPTPFDGMVTARVEEWLEGNMGGDKEASAERAYAGSRGNGKAGTPTARMTWLTTRTRR